MTDTTPSYNNLWVADFTCNHANTSIVEIIIHNLYALYNILEITGVNIDDPAEDILIIHCQFPKPYEHHSNCVYIERANISPHNRIYIKFPMSINRYNINISIQGFSHTIIFENETRAIITTFPVSPSKVLCIPSFFLYNYSIGDSVRIRHPNTNKMITGQICDILHNNTFQINYKNSLINLYVSSIYPIGSDLKYTLKWENTSNDVNMNLYFYKYGLHEQQTLTIEAIFDFFENDRYFGDAYDTWLNGYGHYDKYYLETVSNFFVKNICDFLFEIEYTFDVGCMFGNSYKLLKFNNTRKFYLDEYISIHCDCCGTPLSEWDFGYFCSEQDKMCVECIVTRIDVWNELRPLLRTLLNEQLNSDCIETIINCVIGSISLQKINHKKRVLTDCYASCNNKSLELFKKRRSY